MPKQNTLPNSSAQARRMGRCNPVLCEYEEQHGCGCWKRERDTFLQFNPAFAPSPWERMRAAFIRAGLLTPA